MWSIVKNMDIYDQERRYTRARQNFESIITRSDKKLVDKFILKAQADDLSIYRIIKYYSVLTQLSKLLNKPFHKADYEDMIFLAASINQANLSDWTKRDYKIILRLFYRFIEKPELVDWIQTPRPRSPLPDLLTYEEIHQMIHATVNHRDPAMIIGFYESGARPGEWFSSIRLRNISEEFVKVYQPQVINGNIQLLPLMVYTMIVIVHGKTGGRRIRLIHSAPYIKEWLIHHPCRDDPDAPLWVTCSDHEIMKYDTILRTIQRAGRNAHITKKINLRMFRHSQSTNLANYLTESQLKEKQGWSPNSDMPGTYVHLSGKNIDPAMYNMNGWIDGKLIDQTLLNSQQQ